jgi:hypothetical protein
MTRLAPYRKSIVALVTALVGLLVTLGLKISPEVAVGVVGVVEAILVFAVPNGAPEPPTAADVGKPMQGPEPSIGDPERLPGA